MTPLEIAAKTACGYSDSRGECKDICGQCMGATRAAVLAYLKALAEQGPSQGMIEDGCREIYGKGWDGPAEKMPGEAMKNVWRRYPEKIFPAMLRSHIAGLETQEKPRQPKPAG